MAKKGITKISNLKRPKPSRAFARGSFESFHVHREREVSGCEISWMMIRMCTTQQKRKSENFLPSWRRHQSESFCLEFCLPHNLIANSWRVLIHFFSSFDFIAVNWLQKVSFWLLLNIKGRC